MAIPMMERGARSVLSAASDPADEMELESARSAATLSKGWTIALGVIGTCLLSFISVAVAGGLKHDQALEATHLSWMRFGHGKEIATYLGWFGLCLVVLAWVRAGRLVLAGLVELRWLIRTMVCWVAPLLVAAPLYTRDPYSYLAQGALLRDGLSPYSNGPVMDPNAYTDNVAEVWSTTGSPYGPLFMLIMKLLTTVVGNHIVAGVILTRIIMLPGVVLTFWSVVSLAKHFGKKPETAVWLALLNPLMVVNLVGGAHNEMLMIGLLTSGLVLVLRGQQYGGVALVVAAACIKATAVLALPFIGWIWLAQVARRGSLSMSAQPLSALAEYAKVVGKVVAVTAGVFGFFTIVAGVDLGWSREIFDTVVVVNWLAVPTAVAQLLTITIGQLFDWNSQEVLNTTRDVFMVVMLALLATFWWGSREPLWSAQEAAVTESSRPGFIGKAERFLRQKFAGDTDQTIGRRALVGAVLAMVVAIELSAAAFPWYFGWPLAIFAAFVVTPAARSAIVFWSVALLFMFGLDGDQQMYSVPAMFFAAAVSFAAASAFWRKNAPNATAPTRDALLATGPSLMR
ncbi:polyprenol phosphomannose-dependent alpha 1,6 mannosyltransferase MptB [Segniliparus rugosus]|uniref:Carotene biosynthesis associated membrane protein n=1 Tax=Segniliparus rugosus (strain ATCC BAA-974 / DSM 45345 / CCUG 50838 / CIP 108380 / JCM 13579 / CDC 945) TaxID=679197 RepID=E5XMP3_SEGRC|nr:polyprenol phosphomannose-dependent alpha 1,6 mannosyltransferase MptB [Segniliparus rugosus]EFV14388.2 carotene biosynthesis associated membrane protein [Segniliparus rugosus ATCC BAA-974]